MIAGFFVPWYTEPSIFREKLRQKKEKSIEKIRLMKMSYWVPELLSPAGSLEKLRFRFPTGQMQLIVEVKNLVSVRPQIT